MSNTPKTLDAARERIQKLEEENARLQATQQPAAEASLAKARADVASAEAQREAAVRAKVNAEAAAQRAEQRAQAAEDAAEDAEQKATAIEAEAKLSASDIKAVARLAVLEDALGKFMGQGFDASAKAPAILAAFKSHTEKLAAARAQVVVASLGIDEPLPVSGEQPGTAPDSQPKSAADVWKQNLKP